MKQVLIKQGRAVVEEVPAPLVEAGTVLVRVRSSCVSIGTEMSAVKASGEPLWKRALRQPENVKKVIEMLAEEGISRTRQAVEGQLSAGMPTGYSASGFILEVGSGVPDSKPGDRVACAGAQCAYHAEILRVPRNLAVPIPPGLGFEPASTVTLGAIALQGVRRAQPTLGETFAVIGLGVLGQLTAQLLRINGCRVVGTDLERSRIALARDLGMNAGFHPDDGNGVDMVARFTDGIGVDGVIITAATSSNEVIATAFRMCRKKGRVVLVGDVGLDLNRSDFYQKELDFFISASYGPGRYDRIYEEKGLDYPVGYVRWTENRNMSEYLRLVAEGKVNLAPLLTSTYPLEDAPKAYEALQGDADKPLMVLLSYPEVSGAGGPRVHRVLDPHAQPLGESHIRIAVVGAGGFAKGMHLPNLRALSKLYHLQAVVDRTGHDAASAARQFGASYSSTDFRKVLEDPEVDAALICTRHNLHADMTLQALKAGKHVFVEKPLALTREELGKIQEFYKNREASLSPPILLTGFNRRFSPHAVWLRQATRDRTNPMILNYRMNAGYIPLNHWVHTEEGGGRNLGEACHIYDLFAFLVGSRIAAVEAQSIRPATGHYSQRDNFVATLRFEDGSVATLTYTALGSNAYPKERLEIFSDGRVFFLDDYKRLSVAGMSGRGLESRSADKGHRQELEAFAHALRRGGEWPIPLWEQLQATEIALDIERLL